MILFDCWSDELVDPQWTVKILAIQSLEYVLDDFITSPKCKLSWAFFHLASTKKVHSPDNYHTFKSVQVDSFPPAGFAYANWPGDFLLRKHLTKVHLICDEIQPDQSTPPGSELPASSCHRQKCLQLSDRSQLGELNHYQPIQLQQLATRCVVCHRTLSPTSWWGSSIWFYVNLGPFHLGWLVKFFLLWLQEDYIEKDYIPTSAMYFLWHNMSGLNIKNVTKHCRTSL